jgi:hypothetical protein
LKGGAVMKNKYLADIERRAKAKDGRASGPRYKAEYAEMARALILLELNQGQIAEFFGVSPAAVTAWKKNHPDFKEALERGRLAMGAQLAGTAFKLATGKYKHVNERLVFDKKTGELKTVDFGGTLPPDRQMLTLLLHKKFPDAFPEKQEISLAASAGIGVNIRVVE